MIWRKDILEKRFMNMFSEISKKRILECEDKNKW
jgi:hypothetical protein